MPHAKPVQAAGSSSTVQRAVELADSRTVDRVAKPAAVRTSSGTSSAGSSTRGSVTRRRPSQHLDRASVRPHSVHLGSTLSGDITASNHLDSATTSRVGQTRRSSKDSLQTSSGSANSATHSRPLSGQQAKNGTHTAAVPISGRSKTTSQEERKNSSGDSSVSSARKNPVVESSVPSVRRGSSGTVRQGHSVGRSDSVKVNRAKAETAKTKPDYSGTLRPRTSNGGSQKLTKGAVVNSETTSQQAKVSAAASGMKSASSTSDMKKTAKAESATSRSVRQPNSSSKALSSVPRYIQKDLTNKHILTTESTATSQRTTTFSRQMSDHALMKHSGSCSSLVGSSLLARSEALPSDPVLLRYTPHNSRQYTSTRLMPSRKFTAAQQSTGVLEVSGSSCRPTTFCTLTLMKSEIDKANKDVQHKVYSSDFKVSVVFHMLVLFVQ